MERGFVRYVAKVITFAQNFSHYDIQYIRESNFQPKQLLSRSLTSYVAEEKSLLHARQLSF